LHMRLEVDRARALRRFRSHPTHLLMWAIGPALRPDHKDNRESNLRRSKERPMVRAGSMPLERARCRIAVKRVELSLIWSVQQFPAPGPTGTFLKTKGKGKASGKDDRANQAIRPIAAERRVTTRERDPNAGNRATGHQVVPKAKGSL
jgi:hypothetical protein